MKRTDKAVLEELRSLQRRGVLQPKSVVEAARDKTSPLHDHFTWNNTEAAEQFRILEARKLIAVHVELLPGASEPSPVFVSLRNDRRKGGYRAMVDVLSDAEMRSQLLDEALEELAYFKAKYKSLSELAGIFEEIKKVKKRA